MFDGFINDESVKPYGAEALGCGTKLGNNAASITYGKYGILHGFKFLFLQDKEGKIANKERQQRPACMIFLSY